MKYESVYANITGHLHHPMFLMSSFLYRFEPFIILQRLGGESKLRSTRSVGEDDELRFEEDVAVDGETDAGVGLETAEASCSRG